MKRITASVKSRIVLRIFVALLTTPIFYCSTTQAQSAQPTTDILTRTFMVRSEYFAGTIFSIDVDNREYWITAKHILTGAHSAPFGAIKSKSISLLILRSSGQGPQWLPVDFRVIDNLGDDIDIVVLAAEKALLPDSVRTLPAEVAGVSLGSDCAFLGFPYGIS